jgi:hypothetical protein
MRPSSTIPKRGPPTCVQSKVRPPRFTHGAGRTQQPSLPFALRMKRGSSQRPFTIVSTTLSNFAPWLRIPYMTKRRHRWGARIPHLSICDTCGLLRRQVFYGGGRGSSSYYRATPEGEVFLSSRAPACEPAEPSDVEKVQRAYFDPQPSRPPS